MKDAITAIAWWTLTMTLWGAFGIMVGVAIALY